MPLKVTYLAHDLDDPSIWRRVAMLQSGGAEVNVAGFRRGEGPVPHGAVVLGSTTDGRMLLRARAVVAALPVIRRRLREFPRPDVILARNLEMLLLGAAARGRSALVYELLDVHDLMLGAGPVSRALRRIEARLMRRSAAVMISSPGFERNYLQPFDRPKLAVLLVENKLLASAAEPPQVAAAPEPMAGRLRIGWFGMLRCRWSLQTLDRLTRATPGRYEVVLRGRPSLDRMPEFHSVVAGNPDLSFGGPYRWPDDLDAIYAGVDLTWMIDRYQAGGNSDWLLPNRLYEGGRHGAVPVTLGGTEMARKLSALGIGLTVAEPSLAAVEQQLSDIDDASLKALRAAVLALPRGTWEATQADCEALVSRLGGLASPAGVRNAVGPQPLVRDPR